MEPVTVVLHVGGGLLADSIRPGESWAAAAGRVAAARGGSPVAVDLSGTTKVFAVEPDLSVTLRAMTHGDLPILGRWLREPHVQRWWHHEGEPTDERVASTYGPRIDGGTPTQMWVAEVNGRSVGFVQDYRIRDYPHFALLTPDPDAVGLDYVIGARDWVGRGIGTRVLWTWMVRAARRFPDATGFFAAPDHGNAASLRVLDKVGFQQGTWFDEPQRGGGVATVVGCTLDTRRVLG